jgi:hypothetical protein
MELVLNDYGYSAGGWRVELHPRHVLDLTGDGKADILGFGNAGVYVSRNTGGGSFTEPAFVLANFGFDQGWRVERHPRLLADLTGDARPDIVGFGDAGTYVAKNNGNGGFGAPQLVLANFGYTAGGWRTERHIRALADVTGDRRADVVAFGDAGTWVARNKGDATFHAAQFAVANFGYNQGWRVERHPRLVADLTGDGRADILGFGDAGVYVSRNNGDGTFAAPVLALQDFGYAQGWRVERHPRFLADTTGDGRPDIVGFGDAGTYVSVNTGNGTFADPKLVVANFGYAQGWRADRHPRFLADLTGDGRADIVGFGDAGTYVSLNGGSNTFAQPVLAIPNFGYVAGGWRVQLHPRFVADLTGDRCADIVGFGNAGVWTAVNRGKGTFPYTYTRRNAWNLQSGSTWHPVLLWYARAVRAMRARPASDPTSWAYQAAMHGTFAPEPPGGALYNECQHGSWYFLPWHRMYLAKFEQIVRDEVIRQGGPADWALPYWDYDNPGQSALPPAFRLATLPDGTPNPLRNATRRADVNNGSALAPAVVDAAGALAQTAFTPAPPGTGFGGGQSTPNHGFNLSGALEIRPHGSVHVSVGGDMGAFETAALDPIFWLHHANIDRLWAVWRNDGHADTAVPAWLTQQFPFIDINGSQISMRVDQVVDTVGQLQYRYEDIASLTQLDAGAAAAAPAAAAGGEPEIVGASRGPVELAGDDASAEVVIDERAAGDRLAAATGPARVFLNLEDAQAERSPEVAYELFVDAGAGITPQFVGVVSFFGIESTGGTGRGEAHAFRQTFDITAAVESLRAQGHWDDRSFTVRLRPALPLPPPEEIGDDAARADAAARSRPVRIGRISVVYA